VHNLFFRYGGLPLHTVHFLIPRNPLEVPTTCFAIFPPKISYGFLLGVPLLPRCDHCPVLHPSMVFIALFFLRHSGSLMPRSFIRFLPRSCCLSLRCLISILHSCLFHSLILVVHPFCVFVLHCPGRTACDRVPCAVPLLYGGSSLVCQQQASSVIHDFPGSECS
jgi:hypothetical protein